MSDTGTFEGIPFGTRVVASNSGGRECTGELVGVEVVGVWPFALVRWVDEAFTPHRPHVGRFGNVRRAS